MTIVVGIIGASLSILIALAVNQLETDKAKEYFVYRSEEYVTLIYSSLKTNLTVLDMLAAFYAASEQVEQTEFEIFTTMILANHPSIKALNWIPRVTSAQRAAYEATAQTSHPGFQFIELNSQGNLVTALPRPEYFPIYYLNSQQKKSKRNILGLDLASESRRLQAMIQARDSGRIIMTQPLQSLQFDTESLELLVFVPIYDTKNQLLSTPAQRRQHLQGFVLGVLLVTDLMKEVLFSANLDEMNLQIEDRLASAEEGLLYDSSAKATSPHYLTHFFESFQVVHQREIAGRRWSFLFTSTPLQLQEDRLLSLMSLVSGLTLTGIVIIYLWILINRNLLLKQEIHQRKTVESELQEARQYAELITQTKSDFLITLSQEMRSPLNHILDATQFLLNSTLTVEQRQQTKLLNTANNLLLRLINDISDISNIEAGKLQLEQKSFHLLEVTQKAVNFSRAFAEEKRLTLNLRYHDSLPTYVSGDSQRFRQILTHLINNAIKFTLNGGSIIIEMKAESQDATTIVLHIAIIDSGVGIDPEQHEEIFGKFEQLDASILQHFSDIGGLGLAICRRLIERMGGKIGVVSKKGQGATFWFNLPFIIVDQPPLPLLIPSTEEEPAPLDLHRLRILLVEDNATNRMVTCLMLRKMGCQQIEIVQNGEEAVNITATNDYDLVLMDIHMPVMDGLQATQIIRQREQEDHRKHLLIVALTADTTPESRESCFFAGTDDYLTKPFCQKELLNTLHHWLL